MADVKEEGFAILPYLLQLDRVVNPVHRAAAGLGLLKDARGVLQNVTNRMESSTNNEGPPSDTVPLQQAEGMADFGPGTAEAARRISQAIAEAKAQQGGGSAGAIAAALPGDLNVHEADIKPEQAQILAAMGAKSTVLQNAINAMKGPEKTDYAGKYKQLLAENPRETVNMSWQDRVQTMLNHILGATAAGRGGGGYGLLGTGKSVIDETEKRQTKADALREKKIAEGLKGFEFMQMDDKSKEGLRLFTNEQQKQLADAIGIPLDALKSNAGLSIVKKQDFSKEQNAAERTKYQGAVQRAVHSSDNAARIAAADIAYKRAIELAKLKGDGAAVSNPVEMSKHIEELAAALVAEHPPNKKPLTMPEARAIATRMVEARGVAKRPMAGAVRLVDDPYQKQE